MGKHKHKKAHHHDSERKHSSSHRKHKKKEKHLKKEKHHHHRSSVLKSEVVKVASDIKRRANYETSPPPKDPAPRSVILPVKHFPMTQNEYSRERQSDHTRQPQPNYYERSRGQHSNFPPGDPPHLSRYARSPGPFKPEHDDRCLSADRPGPSGTFPNAYQRTSQHRQPSNIKSSQLHPFHKASFTGYHFGRNAHASGSRSRSQSPIETSESLAQLRQSPPKDMPEHLRWLHKRWNKYHASFFNDDKKADVTNTTQTAHKCGSAGETKPKKSWESDYLKALEEQDPYLEDVESYKRLKLEIRVKDASDKAVKKRLQYSPEQSRDRSRSPRSSDQKRRRHRSRSHSVTPLRSSAHRRAISRYSRPYHDFWKKSALQSGMMTFKEFMMSLNEEFDDDKEVARRYHDYRQKFKRDAFREYFELHKSEAWFREKYHPEETQRKAMRKAEDVRARLDVFMRLLVKGWMDVTLSEEFSRLIRKTLDGAIVLLEGGTEDMLSSLTDVEYYLEERKEEEWEEDEKTKREDGSAQCKDWASEIEQAELQQSTNKPDSVQLEVMQHSKDYSYYIKEKLKEVADMPDFIGTESEMAKTGETEGKHLGQGLFAFQPKEKGLKEMSLHKASAILIRNIPRSVSREELDEMLGELHGGYLRVLLSEPSSDHHLRLAVASFWHNANLAKIAWSLRGYKLRGSSLEVTEYRNRSKRVVLVDGICADKSVVLRDIQLARGLISFLDKKHCLWATPMVNPLLINLDTIIQEHLADLMSEKEDNTKKKERALNIDAGLLKLLDRLLLYLRIVHSVDYYGCSVFENEDDAPQRVGRFHVRGPAEVAVTSKTLTEHAKQFESRLKQMFPQETVLPDNEIEKFGGLEVEPEVEKFCNSCSRPTKDGIVQCKLCEKRFTSHPFLANHVREHHKDDIFGVLQDVFFFNRYLADPKRPCSARFV